MPLSDIAVVNVSATAAGVTRAGYGVPLIVSSTAGWSERTRTYASTAAVAADFAVNSPEYLAAQRIFAAQPAPPQIVIGRAANKPTQQFSLGVQAATATGLNNSYNVRVASATGVAWVSQNGIYNSGNGATAWSPSNTWSSGDLVSLVGALYSCLGQSGQFGGATGIGAASGPSGIGAAIQEGQVWWMYCSSGQSYGAITNDAIVNGIKTKISALIAPPVVGTGAGQLAASLQGSQGSRTLQLLANAAATFFGVQITKRDRMNIAETQADPGIVADLTAIALENNNWYGLVTPFHSSAMIAAAAGWVETNTKLYAASTLDSSIPQMAASIATDVAMTLKNASYVRTWAFYHPSNDEFPDAAEFGVFFPVSPGGETWRMKTLFGGVSEQTYTSTEEANLLAKNCSFYYDMAGVSVVGGNAVDAFGEYIDTVRFIDWYTANLQADLADLVIQAMKIPFTNPGVDQVEAKVRKRNDAGIAAGGIAANPKPIVTAPDVSTTTQAQRLSRQLTGVQSSWQLAGAIHQITVSVTASA